MHELGLAQNTLDLALDQAKQQGASRIMSLRLEVGALSGVMPEALRFALETITRDTPAEGAHICIEPVSPAICCHDCGQEFITNTYQYACTKCGSCNTTVVRGKEMKLISMEVA